MSRYFYALGFDKESYINSKGKENWRFAYTDEFKEALNFYFYMRNKAK